MFTAISSVPTSVSGMKQMPLIELVNKWVTEAMSDMKRGTGV